MSVKVQVASAFATSELLWTWRNRTLFSPHYYFFFFLFFLSLSHVLVAAQPNKNFRTVSFYLYSIRRRTRLQPNLMTWQSCSATAFIASQRRVLMSEAMMASELLIGRETS